MYDETIDRAFYILAAISAALSLAFVVSFWFG
jgi:hypothetical protein